MKCLVLLLLLVPVVALPEELLHYSSSHDAMGTTFAVEAYDEDAGKLRSAVAQAFAEVDRVETVLSNYREDSEWSRINRDAGSGPVRISSESFRLIARCLDYSRSSEGAFDITVGPLLKLWGFYKGTGRVPHRAEIRSALARVGYQRIRLDEDSQTVRFLARGMEIDPGGIGKGYTVDRMVSILRASEIRSAFVTAGNSSSYAIGTPPGEAGWSVTIRDPRSSNNSVGEVVLKDESISTSGDYEKFFMAGGTLYSHIFDPTTGYPATGMLSATVVAPSTTDSEAWTKPVFIRGREWTVRNIPEGFRVFVCEDGLGKTCAWLQ